MIVNRFISSEKTLLNRAFEIRRKVFVEEQNVREVEEFDEFEKSSVHYLLMDANKAVGTARWRITDGGIKLERFAVLEGKRGKGYGGKILSAVLGDLPKNVPVYLNAQITAVRFYEQYGFVKSGPEFMECDIRHFKMVLEKYQPMPMTLDTAISYVHEFHQAFRLNKEYHPTAVIAPELVALRHRLMHEENEEYKSAAEQGDLVEIADALGDMLYILCGTIISHGLQNKIADVYTEIQRSNMSKLDENGEPIYREDGKVMKSNRYFKPDIAAILGSSRDI